MHFFSQINFPTFLTFLRLCLGFFIFPFLIVYILPHHCLSYNVALCALFLLSGITDFLDGYLARKYHKVTALGKILDPIADKFLMYGAWIALLSIGRLWYVWGLLLIGRELLITSIRHIAVEHKFTIVVSDWAKWKTTIHILFVAFLLLDIPYSVGISGWYIITYDVLVVTSLVLSWYSAWKYCREFAIKIQSAE